MKKWIAFCMIVCCLWVGGGTAKGEKGLIDGAVYRFDDAQGGGVLAASLFGMSDIAGVAQLEKYDGSLNQAWRARALEGGAWALECLSTGKRLTVLRNTKKDGGVLSVEPEKAGDTQRFLIEETEDGVTIASVSSGKYVSVKQGKDGDKKKVVQYEEKRAWTITMIDDGATVFPRMIPVYGEIDKISCPEIIKFEGVYYLFGDNRDGCGIRRSTDMIHWEAIENPYTYKNGYAAAWIPEDVPDAHCWCPGIYKIGDKFYIYYALTTLYSQRSTIAIFTNTTLDPNDPAYKWVEAGPVISSYHGDPYNCIDPCVVIDENGDPWLEFGSAWSGLKIVRLNAETGKLLDPEHPEIIGIASRRLGDKAIEGGYMVRRDDYYYLFAAVGIMKQGTYQNGVGRGEHVTGPFAARNGVLMMEGGVKGGATILTEEKEDIIMPGHCSVFKDEDGQWYFVLEYFPAGIDARLGLSTIVWDGEGWPWTALTPNVLAMGNQIK